MDTEINLSRKVRKPLKAYKEAKQSYLNRMRLAVSLFYFSMGLTFATWASRIPDIKETLHLSEADLGTVLFSIPCGQLLMMPFSAKIVVRYGSSKTVVAGIIMYIAAMVSLGFGHERWHLMLSLFFFGVFSNFTNISVNTQGLLTEGIFNKPIMSSFHGAWSLAGFTGALIGLLMMNIGLPPRIHFAIVALILYIVIALNFRHLVKTRPAKPQAIEAEKKRSFLPKLNPALVWLGVIGFCSMVSEGIMFDWSGVYFKEVVKAPESLVVLGYTSFMIMMASGRFIGDKVTARFGRKRVLQVSGVLISGGMYLAVFLPYIIPAAIGFMLVGLGVSTVVPGVYSIAGKTPGIEPSKALTAVSSVSFLGFLIGPPVIGYIAHAVGLKMSFALIGIFGIGIAFLVNRVKAIE
ncbi:major facilitator transporter [Flavobacterium rivuli WB 3.3-2 = DSM 21788]|uniref:Major facilitator transporter n=1 Tax=Flavobacterium rivuli WB 3.3-2 = DSM 21788 TaxID=1121895 RepID=A0A0A2M1J2_9FLAO|nr:MFS transporter [Flavobacterium rivuli]KGO85338.1 major facilitator transporter [Flavobacterium rivuli WB 3.3-2 = DSM 21788]